ncbi:hypothetical protein [Halpernia sp. GG3]
MKKILMILTSHSSLVNTNSKTGVWLSELTDPYYELKEVGFRDHVSKFKRWRTTD